MRVLCVAEKPSVAKEVTHILSKGKARSVCAFQFVICMYSYFIRDKVFPKSIESMNSLVICKDNKSKWCSLLYEVT